MMRLVFLLSTCVPVIAIAFMVGSVPVPVSGHSDLSPLEQLGKEVFFDNISDPQGISCSSCHDPEVGWTGPAASINIHGAVYRGAVPQRFGNRKPPSAAYATSSPVFYYDEAENLFIGGNFWDGRATGEVLGNPAADQAGGPFLNPVEQNMPSKMAVCKHIAESKYADLFEEVYGPHSLDCDTKVEKVYDQIALSIAAYEDSEEVNQFSSKYDRWLDGEAELTDLEQRGLELFNDPKKGNCAACHPSLPSEENGDPPLFTDFSFDNLGVPKNPENPWYQLKEVLGNDSTPINPLGADWIDEGLGGFLANHSDPVWKAMADENKGKHKVPTMRNADKRPFQGFPKAFMHNGVFKTLKEVVHFYNTRDVEKWPPPEVAENVNTDEMGDLGLSDEEEDAIVAFLRTLNDGYTLPGEK